MTEKFGDPMAERAFENNDPRAYLAGAPERYNPRDAQGGVRVYISPAGEVEVDDTCEECGFPRITEAQANVLEERFGGYWDICYCDQRAMAEDESRPGFMVHDPTPLPVKRATGVLRVIELLNNELIGLHEQCEHDPEIAKIVRFFERDGWTIAGYIRSQLRDYGAVFHKYLSESLPDSDWFVGTER